MSTFKDYLTESAKSYDYKIKVAGQIADDFASKTTKTMQDFGEQLETANRYFSTITGKFSTPTAKKIANSSSNIFSVKGMLNNLPVKVTGDQMWSKVLHGEFSKGSADGIKELRFLFGVDNPANKEATRELNE